MNKVVKQRLVLSERSMNAECATKNGAKTRGLLALGVLNGSGGEAGGLGFVVRGLRWGLGLGGEQGVGTKGGEAYACGGPSTSMRLSASGSSPAGSDSSNSSF